ncbi:hypothetical protein QFC19_008151 [Naganishia cerealis]|uniref:Uncharacterized protein n=1 Tax=Naganishia cerealis TaxID=610337 RepID=A0ACC2V470_9TREE|nr:hypothetical protein QFC19_008151 [Naganishia cerealis]
MLRKTPSAAFDVTSVFLGVSLTAPRRDEMKGFLDERNSPELRVRSFTPDDLGVPERDSTPVEVNVKSLLVLEWLILVLTALWFDGIFGVFASLDDDATGSGGIEDESVEPICGPWAERMTESADVDCDFLVSARLGVSAIKPPAHYQSLGVRRESRYRKLARDRPRTGNALYLLPTANNPQQTRCKLPPTHSEMDAQLEAPAATAGAQDARMMEIDELAEDPDSMEDIQHHDEPAPPLEVPQELSNPPQNTAQTTDTPVDTIPPTVGETHDGNSEMRRNNNEAEEKGAGYMESIAEKVDQEANVPPEEPQMADQDRVRPVLELKESPADAEPSEHQAMEGIHEEEAIVEAAPIENSSSIPPLVGPSEIDHEHVPAVQANEADLPSIPVTVSEASPLPNAVSSQAVNSQAVDQQMVDQQALEQQVSEQRAPSVPATVPTIPAAFPASIRTDQHPLNLEGNLTSALTSLPSPGGSEDPFNLKSGDGVFDESVNAKVERSSRHPDHVDNDGLADFSIPESRFAGVILPKSDRRTFREYIPADEVKHTQSLKITLKRPEGWTAPMFKVEEPPYPVAGRRRGGVGRQVKSVAYRNENDTFDDDHPAPSPSRRRKGKKAAKEEAELYGEVGRENKWKNSSSAILSGSDTGSHDQDGFIEIDELDDVRGDNRKKKEREPVRQSGRIAQKFRPSMAEDQAGVGHSKISYNVDDEEIDELARSYSEDSISTSPAPLKQKTTRGRKGRGKKVIDSDDDYTLIPEKAKSQDLDHEVDEDVLIYHRELCDKCFRPSAKDLLKPKKKRGGRKRKKDEFDEGSGDEAERLLGWIECERCTSAFHWACLPGQTRTKALIEDKLLPSQEQIFYKGAPRTDDTLLLVCPHCENELIANCMKCETSDPLPYVAPARTADKDQQPVEIETGIATAMDVDETSETAQVKTDAKIDRQMESEKADQTEGSTPAVVVDGPTVEEQPEVNGKQETRNLQTQQAEPDKPEPEVTSTTKKSEVDDLADVDAEKDELEDMQSDTTEEDEIPLLFRCITCKRCAHYQHRTLSDFTERHLMGNANRLRDAQSKSRQAVVPIFLLKRWQPGTKREN